MRIQHNIPAMNSYRNYANNTAAVAKNLEKLSSGYRINRAGDDAAGLAISEKMRIQITGLEQAQANAKSGINLIQTAEGAMTEVHDMLKRMYTLAEQSANGTYDNEVDRAQLQKEVASLRNEINRIADSTNYNGIKLMDGSLSTEGTSASLAEADLSKITGAMAGSIVTVDPVKGKYQNLTTLADQTVATDGTLTVSFTLKDGDGKDQTIDINLTVGKDAAGTSEGAGLIAEDGTVYDTAAGSTQTGTEIGKAVVGELLKNKTVTSNFTVSNNAGVITLLAKEGGTQAMQLTGFEFKTLAKGSSVPETVTNGAQVATAAVDAFQAVDLSQGKVWLTTGDSSIGSDKLEDCVFEINGEKFVFIEADKVTDDTLAEMKEAGVEHYVELATSGADPAAADIANMAEKISMETGLKVVQGTAATAADTGVVTWTDGPGAGLYIGLKSRSTEGSSKGGLTLQIGDTSEKFNKLTVSIKDMHAKAMGIGSIDISTQEGASAAMDAIKNATNYVSDVRGDLGALQNRLDHTINNLSVAQENIQDAESNIRDVDIAKEMMAYTKNNILVQSAQAMLAQANQLPQGVLQLLQ